MNEYDATMVPCPRPRCENGGERVTDQRTGHIATLLCFLCKGYGVVPTAKAEAWVATNGPLGRGCGPPSTPPEPRL